MDGKAHSRPHKYISVGLLWKVMDVGCLTIADIRRRSQLSMSPHTHTHTRSHSLSLNYCILARYQGRSPVFRGESDPTRTQQYFQEDKQAENEPDGSFQPGYTALRSVKTLEGDGIHIAYSLIRVSL